MVKKEWFLLIEVVLQPFAKPSIFMYKRLICALSFLFFAMACFGQGSGKSVSFNGTSYIDLDSSFRTLTFPITFTYWVKRTNTTTGRIFSANNGGSGYSGLHSQILPNGTLEVFYGDGGGFAINNRRSTYSNTPQAYANWVHCAFVVTSATSSSIYANGVLMGTYAAGTGGSYYQNPNGNGAFGRLLTNVGWDYLVGQLDDFTIWDKALTTAEIRQLMCSKTPGSASQLLGYFDFDVQSANQVFDSSAYALTGALVGSMTLPNSGAAIGDTSFHTYSNVLSGVSTFLSTGQPIEVVNLTPNSNGVQFYEVFSAPNSTTGLPPGMSAQHYFGVFLAAIDNANKYYTLKLANFSNKQLYKRTANDDLTWSLVNPVSMVGGLATFPTELLRQEYLIVSNTDCRLDLGADISACSPIQIWVKDLHYHPTKTYTWNGTQVADSLLVTSGQQVTVEMDSAGCVKTDTLNITEVQVSVNLGADTIICANDGFWVKDLKFHPSKMYTWSTGVVADSIWINSAQMLSVEVDSLGCVATDTLVVQTASYPPPQFIEEIEKCVEKPIVYTFPTGDYTFLWPDGSTLNSIAIDTASLLEFYTISPCGDSTMHSVLVIQNVCDAPCTLFVPNVFTPNDDATNDVFEIGVNCALTSFSIEIFNRWGNSLYYSEDPYFIWDGQFQGRDLSESVYVYILKYSGFDEEEKIKHGTITLLR